MNGRRTKYIGRAFFKSDSSFGVELLEVEIPSFKVGSELWISMRCGFLQFLACIWMSSITFQYFSFGFTIFTWSSLIFIDLYPGGPAAALRHDRFRWLRGNRGARVHSTTQPLPGRTMLQHVASLPRVPHSVVILWYIMYILCMIWRLSTQFLEHHRWVYYGLLFTVFFQIRTY